MNAKAFVIYCPSVETVEAVGYVANTLAGGERLLLHSICSPEDVGEAAREAAESGIERILVAGGDGTIRDAVQGLGDRFPDALLGVLPTGTGNDLAKSLGLASDLRTAVDVSVRSPGQPIDAIALENGGELSWFINVANGGFGGEVADRVDPSKKSAWGKMAYWMSTLSTMVSANRYRVLMSLDGAHPFPLSVSGVAVANGRFVGGGFPIAREARLDDGLLDITAAPPMESVDYVAAGLDFALGSEGDNPQIMNYRARSVRIQCEPAMPFSIDGDLVEIADATFSVAPAAFRIAASPEAPALGDMGSLPSEWSEDGS